MRIPLFIALGIAILGVVLGSFFDLSISEAIASPTNGFGLMVSAILPTIGFATVTLMGGGLVAYGLKKDYHILLRILFFVLAACCLGVAIYYPAGEYFGVNGFYGAAPKEVGYAIVVLPEIGAMVGGYFLFRNCQNKNMWIVFITIIVLLCVALLLVITTIKDNMHRPRFRIVSTTPVEFHSWWEPCKNYKELMEQYNIASDNFKSFPSGHTAETSILLFGATFYPLADKRFEKYQLPIFIGACGLVLLVAFARILAAAHYLSDVSMGATIMLILIVIANEVIMRIKQLHVEEAK